MGALRRILVTPDDPPPDRREEGVLAVLREGAAGIDAAFAMTGARFAEGLDTFEDLKNRLVALSGEMSHPELAAARGRLEDLVRRMPALEDWLDREKAALARLEGLSASVGRMFEELRSSMRLVAIMTQRARIERAGIRGHAQDLDSFGDEIVTLSQNVRQVIERSARRHEDVAALIAKAAAVQAEFERRFGRSLTSLACELGGVLAELGERQARSVAAIDRMAEHSLGVVQATTEAVMALQGGDNVRQRLEHSIAALEMADEPTPGLRAAVAALQAAQLRATAGVMSDDCARVEEALGLLGRSTERLAAAVRQSGGGVEAGASSSLVTTLEAGLAKAAGMMRECEADRRIVDGAMAKLVGFLEGIEATIASLRKSAVDIVFLGTNAGLRASRLGESGRGLLVISRELMIAANGVESSATELLKTLPQLVAFASELRDGDAGSASLAAFDDAVRGSMAVIGRSGRRMAELIGDLDARSGGFTAEIAAARNVFAAMAHHSSRFLAAAADLDRSAGIPGDGARPPLDPAAAAVLRERIYPLYSMAAEREIHRSVVDGLGVADGEDRHPPAAAEAEPEDAFELF